MDNVQEVNHCWNFYHYCVSGHYPSFCFLFKTRFGYWILSPSSVSETLCSKLKAGRWIVSRNRIIVLIYNNKKLLGIIIEILI
jgi:hypothetical protein